MYTWTPNQLSLLSIPHDSRKRGICRAPYFSGVILQQRDCLTVQAKIAALEALLADVVAKDPVL